MDTLFVSKTDFSDPNRRVALYEEMKIRLLNGNATGLCGAFRQVTGLHPEVSAHGFFSYELIDSMLHHGLAIPSWYLFSKLYAWKPSKGGFLGRLIPGFLGNGLWVRLRVLNYAIKLAKAKMDVWLRPLE